MKRSTLQSGSLEFSTFAVRKHRVFKPYDRELSGSTKFSSPFFCHSFRTSPGKSYFSHLSCHIFSIWVGRPSQRDHFFIFFPSGQVTHYNETTLHIFFPFLGRSPIIIRPHFIFFPSGQVTHHNETVFSHSFHLGRSPITMRPFFTHSFILVK